MANKTLNLELVFSGIENIKVPKMVRKGKLKTHKEAYNSFIFSFSIVSHRMCIPSFLLSLIASLL